MLRGDFIPKTTTDQRLLDKRGPSDWVHTDPWRVMRIQAEFVEGFGLLAELGPAVTVFGSAGTRPGSREYELAEHIGAGLAEAGYAVITGGGPGIMEAANRGAAEAGGVSVGLGIDCWCATPAIVAAMLACCVSSNTDWCWAAAEHPDPISTGPMTGARLRTTR